MAGCPRFEYRPSDGRPRVRYWDGETEHYVYTYRLAAVAWGVLDGLGDDRHVDHLDCCPAHTAESNLQAVEPDNHARLTVERTQQRRNRANCGTLAGP